MTERFWNPRVDLSESPVTMVTPTHARIDSLCDAVASIRAQDHPTIEHIVVGDACPLLHSARERLLAIDPGLRIVNVADDERRPDYGSARIAWIRNRGIALARGDFIGHLDDDNTVDPDHVSSLLEALARQPDAAMATSYRKLLVEGRERWILPFHPWSPDVATARHVYRAYERMGIYTSGGHLMRDRVTFHEERDCTVDSNEMLVRREVHERFPFPTEFDERQIEEEIGEDDLFCETLYRQGFRVSASGCFSLNFRLGGRFTQGLIEQVDEEGGVD